MKWWIQQINKPQWLGSHWNRSVQRSGPWKQLRLHRLSPLRRKKERKEFNSLKYQKHTTLEKERKKEKKEEREREREIDDGDRACRMLAGIGCVMMMLMGVVGPSLIAPPSTALVCQALSEGVRSALLLGRQPRHGTGSSSSAKAVTSRGGGGHEEGGRKQARTPIWSLVSESSVFFFPAMCAYISYEPEEDL